MNYTYDNETGHYVVKGAQIQYTNFSGLENDFNTAGRRNFKLIMDEALAKELQEQGLRVSELHRRDETDPIRYSAKIGIYGTSEIYMLSGRVRRELSLENCGIIDMEMRKGHIRNGQVDLEFHISVNTRLTKPVPYLRLDTIFIPINKSKLMAEYEDYEDYDAPAVNEA